MAVDAYAGMLKQIAANGIIVVGIDHAMNMLPSYPQLAYGVRGALDWCATDGNLDAVLRGMAARSADPMFASAPVADLENRLVLGAQSAGNHVVVQMLEHLGCGSSGT